MGVNSTHPDYSANAVSWLRARDVVAGEDAVKAAGEKYLPRLDSQSADEYRGYETRASFFNAAARTAEGFIGLIFRRDPVVRVRSNNDTLSEALATCVEDLDLLGTALPTYARNVIEEVVIVGRCGTLVDWASEGEEQAYATLYCAEDILNWRTERVNGRNVLTLVVLRESVTGVSADGFTSEPVEQIRVLRLQSRSLASGNIASRYGNRARGRRNVAKRSGSASQPWCRCDWGSHCRPSRSCSMGRVTRCRTWTSCR